MLTIIILSVLTIILLISIIVDVVRDEFCETLAKFLAFLGFFVNALALVCVCCSLINIQYDFDNIKEGYDNLNAQVVVYNADTTHNQVEAYSLRQDVLDMNNTISKHKVYSHSPWTSLWYSKEIGNLDKIQLK